MIYKQSPKKNFDKSIIFKDKYLLNHLILKLEDFICLHIDKQIEAGANVIQLFDSWPAYYQKMS
jgi:uroporphyrinogen-III decarboxylase